MSAAVLGFEVEWYDQVSGLAHTLFLKFFTEDNTIEILTDKSAFLKRIYYPDLKLQDLFIGSTVNIHQRLYTIKNVANKATREYLQEHEVRFLVVIEAPSLRRSLSQLCDVARKHRLSLQHFFTTSSSATVATSAGPAVVGAGDTILEVVGLYSQSAASFQRSALSSVPGAFIAPATASDVANALRSLSGVQMDQPTTLCLVKPHVLRAYRTGELLQAINEAGFDIFALFSTHLTVPMAEELFDAYRGVFNDYSAMINSVCAGPALALAVTVRGCDDGYEVAQRFREFCGPSNPALAKVLRPDSLRARFGDSSLLNAVHCTDLPEDGEMECRFFFEALANL